MTISSDESRSASHRRRQGPSARNSQYMIVPTGPGSTKQPLIDRLNRVAGFEIVRTYAARGAACPPIAVALLSDNNAAELRRSAGGTLVIEPDDRLRAAAALSPLPRVTAATSALGPGITVTFQVLSESGQPVEHAEVQLVGEQWTAQGTTGKDGKISLSLYGELPETVSELIVRPRSDYWGVWRYRPELQTDAANTVSLQRLSPPDDISWSGKAMRFDRLPAECRGAGVKIALIDSGIATTHRQLAKINHGINLRSGNASSWAQDVVGHGTPCAGIISAMADAAHGIRGYAPDAELHVCKLPLGACCSDLVAALDYCLQTGIDLVCLGFGCQRGSAIVEQRIMLAKQQGIAIIAAAGNTGGPVQFPACSPHVLAVAALGQAGSYPSDSPQAIQAATAAPLAGGLFVPLFSCRGPELDLSAPGVAVVSCQGPDGYAASEGTSLAASHVAALAALVLAHHGDFRGDFASRDFRRVERLFQILKDTAQPIGHPWQTGAGLPDAAGALGFGPQPWALQLSLDAAVDEMRTALRHVDLAHLGAGMAPAFEPSRGAAIVTSLPLSWPMSTATAATDVDVRALKVAMSLAGLSTGN
jgi:hypothetical protein